MPAKSKAHRKAAGMAMGAKKAGKSMPMKGPAAAMSKMPMEALEKFAGTPEKGLPKKASMKPTRKRRIFS